MFIGYQQVNASGNVKTVANLTVPADTHGVLLQAETQNVRYTMDGTNPTQTSGMLLIAGAEQPTEFSSEDLQRIRFMRGAATNGVLNLHYFSGRAI